MLRAAAVASLGLRRLVAASTTTVVTGSQPSVLLKFIPAPAASPVRRFLPTLDLSRGYTPGRRSNFSDGGDDDGDDYYDSDITGMSNYYDSDMDGNGMDDGSWDDDSE